MKGKVFGLITVFFLISCVSAFAGGEQESSTELSGTYSYGDGYNITFIGNVFTGYWGSSTMSGSYSASGNSLTLNITGGSLPRNTWNWTIVNANTLRDHDGDSWRQEGGGSQASSSPLRTPVFIRSSDFEMDGTVLVGYNGNAANVTIPSSVTSIGEYAFSECTSLRSVTIPSSVTSIGWNAFYGCISLASITIPSSVTSISYGAFNSCTSLTSITVDANNRDYASEGGILYNKARTQIVTVPLGINGAVSIPSSVTSIGDYAFDGCSSLTSVTIPNSVTSIGDYAFYGCESLRSVTIPLSVTSIGVGAFHETAWLNSQPDGLVYAGKVLYMYKGTMPANTVINNIRTDTVAIAGGAFYECNRLTSITIPSSVTSIGNEAFSECSRLTSITIPSSVSSIGERAFYECTGLTSVTIPSSVTSVGDYAFHGTAWLNSQPDGLVYAGKVLYMYKGTMPSNTVINNIRTDTVAIAGRAFSGSGLTSRYSSATNAVEAYFEAYLFSIYASGIYSAFAGSLTSVTIPSSVTSIGDFAFGGCTGLTSVNIPNSVTNIGDGAFQNTGLTSVTIPNSVTNIGDGAFQNTGLTSVTIPSGVTSIGNSAFEWCSSLASITVDANNRNYASVDGILYNKAKTQIITVPKGISGAVSIPAGVTSIGWEAFRECSSLRSVTIPAGVTSIGYWAFRECSSLTSVTIPAGVTSIGDSAFDGCRSLTSITIPSSVTSIGRGAFHDTAWLNSQPDGLVYMGKFLYTYKGTMPANTVINNIRTDTVAIAGGAFVRCESLRSVTIPSSVTSIGDYAFFECRRLTNITIPSSVTSIGPGAFGNCEALPSAVIEDIIKRFGQSPFAWAM